MAFDIRINIPVADQISGVRALTGELGAAETAGVKAGASTTAAWKAAADVAARAASGFESLRRALLGQGLGTASTAVRGIADELGRQSQILQAIRGPQQAWSDSFRSTEKLLEDGKIDVSEYADELTRLNRVYGDGSKAADDYNRKASDVANTNKAAATIGLKMPGASAEGSGEFGRQAIEAAGGQFGEVGDALSKFALTGAIAGDTLVRIGTAAVDAYNENVSLHNSVIELTDAYTSQDQVLAQQRNTAERLHSSVESTVELTKQLADVTHDASITRGDFAKTEDVLGKYLVSSNHQLTEGGALMKELMVATSGTAASSTALNAVFDSMPSILAGLEAGLGKSRAELLDLATSGRLQLPQVIALLGQGEVATTQWAQRTRTLGDELDASFKAGLVQRIKDTGAAGQQVASFFRDNGGADFADHLTHAFGGMTDAESANENQAKRLASAIIDLKTHLEGLVTAGEAVQRSVGIALAGQLQVTTDAVTKFSESLEKVKSTPTSMLVAATSVLGAQRQAAQDYVDISAALHAGIVGGLPALERQAALFQQLHGYVDENFAAYQRLVLPQQTYTRQVAALNSLLAQGAISYNVYAQARRQLISPENQAATAEYERQKAFNEQIKASIAGLDQMRDAIGDSKYDGLSSSDAKDAGEDVDGLSLAYYNQQKSAERDAVATQKLSDIVNSSLTPAERYSNEIHKLNEAFPEGSRDGTLYAGVLQNIKDRYVQITPQQQYNADVRSAIKLFQQGAMDAKTYADALDQIKDKYNVDKGAAAGFVDGLNAIKTSLGTSNGAIKDAMTSTWTSINTLIVGAATSGKAAWSDFGSAVEQILAQLALKMLEMRLFSLIPGLGGVSAGGVNMTGDGSVGGLLNAFAGSTGGTARMVGGGDYGYVATSSAAAQALARRQVSNANNGPLRMPADDIHAQMTTRGGARALSRQVRSYPTLFRKR